jgi:hypothetical protein
MENSDWISFGAALVSVIALITALIAIWKTHFAKFSPITTFGYCTFRIYPIKNEEQRWFIPSFDIPINLTNKGAQIGKIEDLRLKVTFPKLPIKEHHEYFSAKWIVKPNQISKKRFNWINEPETEKWMPMILLAKETKSIHIVFESFRWEEPVIQEELKCTIEIKTDKSKKYIPLDSWQYSLRDKDWYDLAENGRAHLCSSESSREKEEYIKPKDLHKYTGTKEEIKQPIKKSSPSYLDFNAK